MSIKSDLEALIEFHHPEVLANDAEFGAQESVSAKWLREVNEKLADKGKVVFCHWCGEIAKPSCAEFPHP